MPVKFRNYDYTYERNGKPVFAPSDIGAKVGNDIKSRVERSYTFDPFIYHLRKKGGHVAALHAHRPHNFFARTDISRFFYSRARNRVRRALTKLGIDRALHYAKWSCVKNPYGEPSYALPYGFIQSPVLATLVLMESEVGAFLRKLDHDGEVRITVYMDDISLSSDDMSALEAAFDKLVPLLQQSEFNISPAKTRGPGPVMDLFNCDLEFGRTTVQDSRSDLFFAEFRTPASEEAFIRYCQSVEVGNALPEGAESA